jgi:hypothetical protein
VIWRAARRGESAGSSDVDRQGQSQGSETVYLHCNVAGMQGELKRVVSQTA